MGKKKAPETLRFRYTTLNIYTHIDRNHKEKQANSLNGLLEHSSLNLRAKQTNVRKVI